MMRVMVVDDTAVDRMLAGGLIQEAGNVEVVYANNGQEAFDRMDDVAPDLVVTDMQMPEMDGLELVTQIRTHFPNVPVILMTAQGSEAIAVEALERGASSYVPKAQLNTRLRHTVQDVLSLSQSEQSYEHLIKCQKRVEFGYELDNDPALINAIVDLAQQMVRGLGLTDHTGTYRVGIAFREALNNSLYHGNLELSNEEIDDSREALMIGGEDIVTQRRAEKPYSERRIYVDIRMDREEARFIIEDEGPGFDYVSQLTTLDPKADGSLEGDRRGFVLMLTFMDEVSFNETGNRVTMVKQKDA